LHCQCLFTAKNVKILSNSFFEKVRKAKSIQSFANFAVFLCELCGKIHSLKQKNLSTIMKGFCNKSYYFLYKPDILLHNSITTHHHVMAIMAKILDLVFHCCGKFKEII